MNVVKIMQKNATHIGEFWTPATRQRLADDAVHGEF
jgi:hypothetical protein